MKIPGSIMFAIAIVWAAVTIASAHVLKGTEYWGQITPILGGGAAASIVLLGGHRKQSDS